MNNPKKKPLKKISRNKFAYNLYDIRTFHDVKRAELAENINVSKQAICNYELGNREPCLDTLIDIADFFHVSLDFLLGRNDK